MTGPDEIRERWDAWQAEGGEQRTGPEPIAAIVGRVMGDVEHEQIVQRWRLYGAEREALANLARALGDPRHKVKLYFAHLGLCLARAEEAEDIVARAIYHARRALADSGPPSARLVELTPDMEERDDADGVALAEITELAEPSEHPHAQRSAVAARVAALRAVATAPQEHALIDAFVHEGCSTLADVQRLRGWKKGHAATVARRLREKADRSSAA